MQMQSNLKVINSSLDYISVSWQIAESGKMKLKVIDMLGRILMNQDIVSTQDGNGNTQFAKPLSGAYLFLITNSNDKVIARKKVIVQK